MKTKQLLVYLIIMLLASCKPEEQPPVVSYVFTDVSVDVGQTKATITCRNTSVDDEKVHASVLLSKNENITDATKYPLRLQNDTLRGTISGLEKNTMYYFCFEVYTANEHKRTDEVHHFQTMGGDKVTVTTSEAINVTQTTATGGGSVSVEGNGIISMRGVCWDTVANPNALQSPHLVSGEGAGTFLVNITGLIPGTTYHMKAYAVCDDVVYYGNGVDFVTLSTLLPAVTTSEITNVTETTATGGGNVTATSGADVIERGICWGTNHNPTIGDNHASSGSGMGSYTCNMTGLIANTTYYVRAYAKNEHGTGYGSEVSFVTTQTISLPTVTTNQVTNITQTTATAGGDVTNSGNAAVIERGVCWSTSHNPTTIGSHAAASNGGVGGYTVNMTGLSANTTYYIRAYATNSAGTSYGTEVGFNTMSLPQSPIGAINGLFSVNSTQQVYFSQGNLQYQASSMTWRFAMNQYDYVGNANANISQVYSGWIDLFGWGTSGHNHGAQCYQPWSTSVDGSGYYAYGYASYNLYDQTGQADWGCNLISNGGNTTNTWRTLTQNEWAFVFNTRITSSNIRYAKAQVNTFNGVILLPDDWSESFYPLINVNNSSASYSSNIITAAQWSVLEQKGAVFLPAAGNRSGSSVFFLGSTGYYWSSSHESYNYAYCVNFIDNHIFITDNNHQRSDGLSVRLVQDVNK